ncbi:MAG TPA: SMC family ATPase [Nitrososphaeraceae archaeon]|nr:SMC family ATPase [Nitrososphaeraceae archaeon]
MKILRIEIENFKPYTNVLLPDTRQDPEFPEGLFLITGNNSMGKTSFIQAMLWGLLGDELIEDQQRKTLVKAGESGCKVDVTFDLGGTIYRIVRKLTIKKLRTQRDEIDFNEDAVLSKKVNEYDIDNKNDRFIVIVNRPRPVNEEVERMLGVSASIIEKTVYVRQKDVDRLALADPVELRRLITTLFGLDEFDRVKNDLSKLSTDLQDSISLLKGEVGILAIEKAELIKRENELRVKEKECIESEYDLNKTLESLSDLPSEDSLKRIKNNDMDIINKNNELALVNSFLVEKTNYIASQDERIDALKLSIENLGNQKAVVQKALESLPNDKSLSQLDRLFMGIKTYENQIRQVMERSSITWNFDPVSQPEQMDSRLQEISSEVKSLDKYENTLHSNIEYLNQILISNEVISGIKKSSIKYIEEQMKCPVCNKSIDDKEKMVMGLGNEIREIDFDYDNVDVQVKQVKDEYDEVRKDLDIRSKTKAILQNMLPLCNSLINHRKDVSAILDLYHAKSIENLLSFLGFTTVSDIISERTSLRLEIEYYKKEILRIKEQIDKENIQYRKYQNELSKLEDQKKNIVNDIDQLKSKLQEYLRELLVTNLDDLLKNLLCSTIDEIIIKRKTMENSLDAKRRFLDILIKQALALKEDIKNRESNIKKLSQKVKILSDKENELRHVKYLRGEIDAFISDYVVEGKMVGVLRHATNDYMTQLTEGRYTVDKISSTIKRVRGGMESHGLEITLMDGKDNVIKNKDQLSGGDETALGLALRIAISKLMARIKPFKNSERKPPIINSIIMDEPMASLDSSRKKILVNMLTQARSFKQIFLVTHTETEFGDYHSITLKGDENGNRQVVYTPVKL